jgi:hypothetical protein
MLFQLKNAAMGLSSGKTHRHLIGLHARERIVLSGARSFLRFTNSRDASGVEEGTCSCLTEQGTKYTLGLEQCRAVAINDLYEPYLEPARHAQGERSSAPPSGASHEDIR